MLCRTTNATSASSRSRCRPSLVGSKRSRKNGVRFRTDQEASGERVGCHRQTRSMVLPKSFNIHWPFQRPRQCSKSTIGIRIQPSPMSGDLELQVSTVHSVRSARRKPISEWHRAGCCTQSCCHLPGGILWRVWGAHASAALLLAFQVQ